MPARCRKCHRILTTPAAVEAGYGPVCYAKEFGKSLYSTSKATRSAGSSPRIRMRMSQAAKRKKIEPMPLLTADVTCSRDADGKAHVNIPQRIRYHSPSGIEWGYGGSGPADLALNILSLYVEERTAYELHQQFKQDFITVMPHEGGTIKREDIITWLETKKTLA